MALWVVLPVVILVLAVLQWWRWVLAGFVLGIVLERACVRRLRIACEGERARLGVRDGPR